MSPDARAGWRDHGPLLAALLVAGCLRVVDLGGMSVWPDEAVSLTVARQASLGALASELRRLDAAGAPLHPVLLRTWMAAFGTSDTAARSFSGACSLAALVLVHGIARRLFGPLVAAWAALLMAVNPLDVYHAREARMYALLALATCAGWALLVSFRRSATIGQSVAYALTLAALVYAHPLGLLMTAALAVGYWVDRRVSALRRGRWLAIQAVAGLSVLPWLPRYLDHPPQFLNPRLAAWHLVEWPESFTAGRGEAVGLGLALVLWGWLGPTLQARRAARGTRSGDRHAIEVPTGPPPDGSGARLLLVWLLVPVLLLLAMSWLRHPVFGPRRYLLFVGPAYLLLIARGLAALPRWPRVAVGGLLVATALAALPARVYDTAHHRNDWRSLAAIIQQYAPDAPICFDGPALPGRWLCLAYYLDPSHASRLVETQMAPSSAVAPASGAALWLITASPTRPGSGLAPAPLGRQDTEVATWRPRGFLLTLHRHLPGSHPAHARATTPLVR